MKRLALVLMLSFCFVCVNVVHAGWLERFWEDVKRESTRFAHDVERETTRFARDVDRELGGIPGAAVQAAVDVAAALAIGEAGYQVQRVIYRGE